MTHGKRRILVTSITKCMAKPARARPAQTRFRGYWTKVFIRRREVIRGVNARASMLRSSIHCGCAQNKGGVCQFSSIRAKNRLPYQRPLNDWEKRPD